MDTQLFLSYNGISQITKDHIQKHVQSLSKGLFIKRDGCDEVLETFIVQSLLCTGEKTEDCTCRSCRTSLHKHPDFCQITRSKGHTNYQSEDFKKMLAFYETKPVISTKKVVLINEVERVSELLWQSLLKVLEDNKDVLFVLLGKEEGVLATILSRVEVITPTPLLDSEWEEICKSANLESEQSLLGIVCENNPAKLSEALLYKETFYQVLEAYKKGNKKALLEALGLVKEKDTQHLFVRSKAAAQMVYGLLIEQLIDQYIKTGNEKQLAMANRLNKEGKRCFNSSFTKDDFTHSMMCFLEGIKELL